MSTHTASHHAHTVGLNTGQTLYTRAKQLIPGGTQLLSKRPEMFLPDHWPAYYSRARGAQVWDLDNRRYVDMSYNGLGSCILGAADPDVDQAVRAAIDAGSMSTLNCPEEVELAELLCDLHPWADKVRYARCGGEAMALAVRLARAATGRDEIAFCGYHGWHDWYLAANLDQAESLSDHLLPGLSPAGVPRGLAGTAHPFAYNHIDQLREIVTASGDRLAAIVMEPLRTRQPDSGFLEVVRQIAWQCGAVLIFDEITSGWRFAVGGAHLNLGTDPDVAVFAKAMSNGYAMAAVIGTAAVMEAAQDTFNSSTYWSERIGPAAALATIKKVRACNVPTHLHAIGQRVQSGWQVAADQAGLAINVGGLEPLAHLSFEHDHSRAIATLFTQEMLERGFLATPAFYATYAHRQEHVDSYLDAVADTFKIIVDAIEGNKVEQALHGPIAHAGFYRLA